MVGDKNFELIYSRIKIGKLQDTFMVCKWSVENFYLSFSDDREYCEPERRFGASQD